MRVMKKQQAIELLGGTITLAAQKVGVSYHAVNKWPAILTPRISDRVVAALARQQQAGAATAAPSHAPPNGA